MKKALGAILVAAALVAVASPSSADGEMQCFPGGPVYWMGFMIAPCELGIQPVECLRCVTEVVVKGPFQQVP